MRAWFLDAVNAPLEKRDVDVPVPGPGQVLVRVARAGLCHSDIGFVEGVIPSQTPFPRILGHEVSGWVAAVGEGVTAWSVGDEVVSAIARDEGPGISRDGGYAEYAIFTDSQMIRLPEGVSLSEAAAATDAGVTAYTGVVVFGKAAAGDTVLIVGLGGLGMIGAQIALAQGATVVAVEPRATLWATALEYGVTEVVADVSEVARRDFDLAVDFAGFGSTTAGAIRAVKIGGRVVLIGLGTAEWTINSLDLITRTIDLQGATVEGDPAHVAAVLQLIADGAVRMQIEEIAFDDIADGLGRLQRGEVSGRLVAVMTDQPS